jgi:hypothetical protein
MNAMHGKETSTSLRADLLLVLFLVGLDMAARLLPHAPNFTPVAASALFAGFVLQRRSLALIVPVAAMALGNLAIGSDDWRITAVIYVAVALPAVAGMLARRYSALRAVPPTMVACSLLFFVMTNFAVWLFSDMYDLDVAGLSKCYIAALPFLKYTVAGDLFWAAILFGGAWLVQTARPALRPRASARP